MNSKTITHSHLELWWIGSISWTLWPRTNLHKERNIFCTHKVITKEQEWMYVFACINMPQCNAIQCLDDQSIVFHSYCSFVNLMINNIYGISHYNQHLLMYNGMSCTSFLRLSNKSRMGFGFAHLIGPHLWIPSFWCKYLQAIQNFIPQVSRYLDYGQQT